MYRHVVNNSAIAVWIIYSVLVSKLTRIRNIDDEPRIYEICIADIHTISVKCRSGFKKKDKQ